MYTEFFGLKEKPFAITPDPRYLYLSARHADALAHLVYGVSESGGFIQLTGEVGTGKTTLIRCLLEQLPENAEIALILNPQLTRHEFLQAICEELRVATDNETSVKGLIGALNRHLLQAHAAGRRIVLIVDEAQTLDAEVLEQVRLLTNLETAKQKLLQIILIGQPELRELLARREMRQIAQRVTGRYHLEPLTQEETAAYLGHRMRIAGGQAEVFSPSAVRTIFRHSDGIPRLINVIADHALLAAYTRDQTRVDGRLVRMAVTEVFGARTVPFWLGWSGAGVLAGIVIAALALSFLLPRWQGASPSAEAGSANSDRAVTAPLAGLPVTEVISPAALSGPDELTAAESAAVDAAASDAAATERLISLSAMLDDPLRSFDTDTAVSQLFGLWGIDYEPGAGTACDQAGSRGLRCLIETGGSISQLRRINRPAILSLRAEQGVEYQLVLIGLGHDYAELTAGGEPFKVALADLTHYWFGDHLLLWRPEVSIARDLMPGVRDDAVVWLRQTLSGILGETLDDADSRHYDAQLEARVRAYQRDRMLDVDGIVGTKTQIALTTDLAAPDTPWLRQPH